ncbi:MAG: hypothetical protein NZM37_07655 [Sandaracinaceae bacterium]|nr:hypothetical protein [Sandaracinaceae bacterium]
MHQHAKTALLVILVFVGWLAPSATCRGEEPPSTSSPIAVQWAAGPQPELLAAPIVMGGLGVAAIAGGIVFFHLASERHGEALLPQTTQARALALSREINDLSSISTALFVGGGVALGISALWSLILPFSSHPIPPTRTRAHLNGLSLEFKF